MSDWLWIAVAVVAAVVVAVVVIRVVASARRQRRTRELRERFGPEYQRAVGDSGRERGERALEERVQTHDGLDLRPVPDEQRRELEHSWAEIQREFVESPAGALRRADHVVSDVLRARGYPLDTVSRQADVLSVDDADLAHRYRSAADALARAETNGGDEQRLRESFLAYRDLFDRLVHDDR